VHNGLTPFGRDVVREMNRLGMLVDLAHATYAVVAAAVDASDRPLLVSHTNIQDYTGFARFVTPAHAQLVGRHGGVLGAWPISIRPAGFDTFISYIKRMVDAVGVDHVAIGTDMGASIRGQPSSPAMPTGRPFRRRCSTEASGATTSPRSWA